MSGQQAEIDRLDLPLDERAFAALLDALGQDEDDAQHALDAVMPALREAWDDGYYHGAADERDDPGGKTKWPNPHRVYSPAWMPGQTTCPGCGEHKFVGHGPLCGECYQQSTTPGGES